MRADQRGRQSPHDGQGRVEGPLREEAEVRSRASLEAGRRGSGYKSDSLLDAVIRGFRCPVAYLIFVPLLDSTLMGPTQPDTRGPRPWAVRMR